MTELTAQSFTLLIISKHRPWAHKILKNFHTNKFTIWKEKGIKFQLKMRNKSFPTARSLCCSWKKIADKTESTWSQLKLLKIVKYLKLWKCCLQFNPISIMSWALNRQRAGTLSSWFNRLRTIQILTLTKKSYYQISLLLIQLREVLFATRLLGWLSGGDIHIWF